MSYLWEDRRGDLAIYGITIETYQKFLPFVPLLEILYRQFSVSIDNATHEAQLQYQYSWEMGTPLALLDSLLAKGFEQLEDIGAVAKSPAISRELWGVEHDEIESRIRRWTTWELSVAYIDLFGGKEFRNFAASASNLPHVETIGRVESHILPFVKNHFIPNHVMQAEIEEHLDHLGILRSNCFYLQLQKFDNLPYLAAKMWLQDHFMHHNDKPQDWHLALRLLKKMPLLASEKYFEERTRCFLRPFGICLYLGDQQEILEEVLAHCPDAKLDVREVFKELHWMDYFMSKETIVSLINILPEVMTSRTNCLHHGNIYDFVLLEYLFHCGYDEQILATVAERWPTDMTYFQYAPNYPLGQFDSEGRKVWKADWKAIENILPHLDHFTCDLWPFSWRAIRQALLSLSDTSFCQLQSLRISLPAFDAPAMNSLKQIFENKYHALQKICLSANARVRSVELVNKATLRVITEAIASARSKAGWRLEELTLEFFLLPVSLVAADATRCLTFRHLALGQFSNYLFPDSPIDYRPDWEFISSSDEANRCPIGSLVLEGPYIIRQTWLELWDEIARNNKMEKICLSSFTNFAVIGSAMSRVASLTCLKYLAIDDRAVNYVFRFRARNFTVWPVSDFQGILRSLVPLLSNSGHTLEYLRWHLPKRGIDFSQGEGSLLQRGELVPAHCTALKYLSIRKIVPGAVSSEALLEVLPTMPSLEYAEIFDRKFHFTASPTIALRSFQTSRRKCVFCNHEATSELEAVLWRNREIKPRFNQLCPQDGGQPSLLDLIEMLSTSDSRLFKYTEPSAHDDDTDTEPSAHEDETEDLRLQNLFEAALASSKSQKELQKLEAKHDIGAGNEPSPAPAALTVLSKARSEAVGDLTELLKLVRKNPTSLLTVRSRYLESLSVRYELLRNYLDTWCLGPSGTRRSPRKQRSSTDALHVSS